MNRNLVLDFISLAASILVIFIHYPLPGNGGSALNCLARISVPLFMAIAGYFSFDIDCSKIKKRTWKHLRLFLIAYFLNAICIIITRFCLNGESIWNNFRGYISLKDLAAIVFLNNASYQWYFVAMAECYCMYYIVCRFYGDKKAVNYSNIYTIAFILFVQNVMLSLILPAYQYDINYRAYRNVLFFTIPLFSLGLFTRQYEKQIINRFGLNSCRCILIMILGVALSLFQWFAFGKVEMPVAMVLCVEMIIILSRNFINIRATDNTLKWSTLAKKTSLIIYIIHPIVGNIINMLNQFFNGKSLSNTYILSFVVLFISVGIALIFELYRMIAKSSN